MQKPEAVPNSIPEAVANLIPEDGDRYHKLIPEATLKNNTGGRSPKLIPEAVPQI